MMMCGNTIVKFEFRKNNIFTMEDYRSLIKLTVGRGLQKVVNNWANGHEEDFKNDTFPGEKTSITHTQGILQ
jgi:hypothetical protein